ncbi:TolC family protein [bacterium]|jgi:outer membrane protein TolC|nr:TolC family protein [bacterium]
MKITHLLSFPVALLLPGVFLPALAAPLSLEAYLEQVRSQSPAVKSSLEQIEGTAATAKEKEMLYIPRLFLNTTHTIDRREFPNAFFGGRTNSENFNFGVEKLFRFGMNARVGYSLFNNTTSNLPALLFPNGINAYTQGQTQVDLNQSLWRNFFGKETRAQEALAEASSLSSHYAERYKLKQTLANAENAYHRAAVANESVKLETELLDRSRKILDWTSRRVQNHLTDKIDLLQARANLQNREISLEMAVEEQRSANLAMNQFRGIESNEVAEDITLQPAESLLNLTPPRRAEATDDVKAAEQGERITRANNEIALQKAQPDLSLYASASYNGIDRYLSPALRDSFSFSNHLYVFGIKFSFPIYFWETSEIRSGRVKQQLAAESATRQKVLENTQAWADLTRKLSEAQTRLKMASSLIELQKEKLEYEKFRFTLGRTTTYQVLMFEQDYAQALISRLRVEREILSLNAQIKTFAEERT